MTVTPQSASETATTALYRATLGPVGIGRYLPVFARFDEAGRAGPSWNWAAALLTLNWLVFRRLWGAALLYVAAVAGLALLVLGLGREGLGWSSLAEWGFSGALVVLSCLIPGVYGNVWLHADARRRMTRAVRGARTVREACAVLAKRAATPRRLAGLVIINGLLGAAALGAGWGLSRWVADLPVPPKVVAPGREALVAPPPVAPVPSAAPDQEPSPPAAGQPAAPAPAPAPAQPAEASQDGVAPVPTPAPQPGSVRPLGAVPLDGFAINVGLFADTANADRVHTRLLDAGLPAYIQVVDVPSGQRTRVRVGPFASRALADAAAVRIRALGLEAQVFRQ